MNKILLCVALSLLSLPAIAREGAPAPNCLDARAVERVRAVDENTLVVAAENGRFVVAHASGCDTQKPASLLAQEGWVCGREKEFVQSAEVLCPILSVTPIDGRIYASLAAAADQRATTVSADGTVSLAPVEVTANSQRRAGFRGDTDYCFAPSSVRGWQLDGNELVIQTSPKRAGGNKSYRVELSSSCPELEWADNIAFESGVGIGMICGHPGDRAVPRENFDIPGIDERGPPGLSRTERARSMTGGCAIASVYPAD